MTGVASRVGRAVLALLIGLMAWRALATLVLYSGELSPRSLSRTSAAWKTPVEERIRVSLAQAPVDSADVRRPAGEGRGRRTAAAAYSMLEGETPPGARVYFAAAETLRGFRVYKKLAALLYPRAVFAVCSPPGDWTTGELAARWGVAPGSYVLAFELDTEFTDPRLTPLVTQPGLRLFRLEAEPR